MTEITNDDYAYYGHNIDYIKEQEYQQTRQKEEVERKNKEQIVYNYYVQKQKEYQKKVDDLSWKVFKDLVFLKYSDGFDHLQELYHEMLKTMECYNKTKDQNFLNVHVQPHPFEPHYIAPPPVNPPTWTP